MHSADRLKDELRFSVLTTVFNMEAFLGECIESVLNQTVSDFELVIVDDHSTDGSFEVAQGYAERDSRIRVYRNPKNLGDHPNRNEAIRKARCEYLKFVDADDTLLPQALEVYRDAITRSGEKAPAYYFSVVNPKVSGFRCSLLTAEQAYRRHYVERLRTLDAAPVACVYRKSVLQERGLFEPQAQIGDFFARLIATAREFRFTHGTAFYRKPVEGHVSQRVGDQHMRSQLRVLRSYRQVCAGLGDPPHLLEAYEHQVCGVAYRAATTMEEMSHLPESLNLIETHPSAKCFEFPSAAMNAVSTCIGIRNAFRFRSLLTRLRHWLNPAV